MREILFKGKRLDSEEWVEGSLSLEYYKKHGCVMIMPNEDECYKVEPNTVCEYTGLIDKNGKKIFEGDICVSSNGKNKGYFVVKYGEFRPDMFFNLFEECYYKLSHNLCGFYCQGIEKPEAFMLSTGTKEFCEVIGNIHDNPELLKG